MTREDLATLSDEQLNERIAVELMGWRYAKEHFKTPDCSGGVAFEYDQARWYPPKEAAPDGHLLAMLHPPAYTQTMHLAWSVVQRIMRIPESAQEASIAPNTRFGYAFEREAFRLACSSEQEAARWICEQALLAWYAGPLVPEEQADG